MALHRKELLDRLRDHEDSYVERKTSTVTNAQLRQTLVAFANTVPSPREAVLFIGVRDNGEVEGVENADGLQKKIRRCCEQECYPPIPFTTELLKCDGKVILAVVVPPSHKRPHFAGPAYVRVGTESVKASDQVFADLIASRTGKAAELIRYRGREVTVATEKKLLGRPDFKERDGHQEEFTCEVLDVNTFFIRMRRGGAGESFTEPLSNVMISYDDRNNRPLIIITKEGLQ